MAEKKPMKLLIEGLVAAFRAAHGEPIELMYAATHLVATGVLPAGWGVFVRPARRGGC